MEIEERRADSAAVLSPVGPLAGAGARLLEDRVSEIAGRGEAVMVLDCRRVSYVGRAGLRALLLSARTCLRQGGELIVASLHPDCRRIVEVSGLLRVLDYRPTVEAAIAASGGKAPAGSGQPAAERRRPFAIEERKDGTGVVLRLVGRLTGAGAGALEARVAGVTARGDAMLVLDCARMTYVNSAGLRSLLICARACRRAGGKLVIARLLPECRSVLDTSGFLLVIDYHDTAEAALAALA